MCYYISKVYNYEILKMRCEFSKDENGTVRFIMITTLIDLVFLCFINSCKKCKRKGKPYYYEKSYLHKLIKQSYTFKRAWKASGRVRLHYNN